MTSKYSSRSMDYEETVWEQLYKHLKEKGFEVYAPGEKLGDCERPYLVVMIDTGAKHISFSTDQDYYTILCYVPYSQYSKLERLILSVKEAMVDLKPMLRSNGYRSPSFADDTIKAHMVSLQYYNYKKQL